MIGAGGCPSGSALAGYGVVDTAHSPIDAPLPDQATSFPTTCRLLVPNAANGGVGDWAFTADGRVVGCGTARQLVQLAMTTVLGSSCSPTLGFDFAQIQEQGPNLQRQVATLSANALAPQVKAKVVQLQEVDAQQAESNPDAVLATVKWKDLSTGQEDTQTIGT